MGPKLFRNVGNQIPHNIRERIPQEVISLGCVQLPEKDGYRWDLEMFLIKYTPRFNGNVIRENENDGLL
jgi:hypothetical protein